MDNLRQLIEQQFSYVQGLRRLFHSHPELSGQEFSTQQKILAELAAMGIAARPAAGTGVIADIAGGLPGKTVALRADMDALALAEELDTSYKSQNSGVCHACGHDGHMAMLLGLAKIFTAQRHELPGRLRLVFQPSEENFPGGASSMIAEGALTGVDAILGAHLWQPLDSGCMAVLTGPVMASANQFSITVQGRGGHASMPQQTVDAILTGAQIVAALNTVVARSVDPQAAAVVSVGVFRAGEAPNIIADSAFIHGTVRVFDTELRQAIFHRIEEIATGICQAAGASCLVELCAGYPPVINNSAAVVDAVVNAGRQTLGAAGVVPFRPVLAGEDFGYYLEQVPGAFMFIGAGNPAAGITYPHHHPKFDIDEQALVGGMEVLARAALNLLSN
ncbi:M20 family metallopeptidase [Sporomusa aerivorans]|uniref:M20 metallopeptidase family protein n=1 Tax=Sporomusa aerivorans TaxID=204936 RepID=UPI00352A1BCE